MTDAIPVKPTKLKTHEVGAQEFALLVEEGINPFQIGTLPVRTRWATSGLSAILLAGHAKRNGFKSPLYLTLNEVGKLGGRVSKDEMKNAALDFGYTKGTTRTGEEYPRLRYWRVYSLNQTNLPVSKMDTPDIPVVKPMEITLAGLSVKTSAKAKSVTYSETKDILRMPSPKALGSANMFMQNNVFGHSLAAGHESRINRRTVGENGKYGQEVLGALISTALILARGGIPMDTSAWSLDKWAETALKEPWMLIQAANAGRKSSEKLLHIVRK